MARLGMLLGWIDIQIVPTVGGVFFLVFELFRDPVSGRVPNLQPEPLEKPSFLGAEAH